MLCCSNGTDKKEEKEVEGKRRRGKERRPPIYISIYATAVCAALLRVYPYHSVAAVY